MRLFCPISSKTEESEEKDMQTTENGYAEAQGLPENTTEQTAPTMRKTIGGTTYIVTAHFSETSKETMSDKICRMIKRDIESGNY